MAGSAGERKVEAILKDNRVHFAREYEFPDLFSSSGRPLRMDFVIFADDGSIDYAIEFQGEQHYRAVDHFGGRRAVHRQKYNDRQKAQYCLDHGIKLITIPYWDFDLLTYDYIIEKTL